MKVDKFIEKSYGLLKDKMIAVPKGNPFSVFHYAPSESIEKMSGSVMNLYFPLSATKNKKLNLDVKGPTRIFVLKRRKEVEKFTMVKDGIFTFYMELEDKNKVLSTRHTYDEVIKSLSQDIYLDYCEKFADKHSSEDEKQREFLSFLSDVDAMEFVKTINGAPLIFSNEGEYVERMKPTSFYESYKAILYSFSYKDEELKRGVYRKVDIAKRNAPQPPQGEQMKLKI